eukprot:CAMPEP_0178980212 /NCGR_PEP_ID=MMETSP0789-20121207/26352_1 /TAXON_ID=3005 /ORGANISM="Rhizosolenia setigera, Strain CCMP 1694" /LENGTH=344 /DNA_ID=CAMNT_0020670563 /DNA_START=36 /DNA_END=1070 /DNA_ORIENTATION=-
MPEQNIASEVISASIGGAFSASALYPLEVIKTKMQASSTSSSSKNETDNTEETEKGTEKSSSSKPQSSESSVDLAKRMYDEGGLSCFYNGVGTSAFQSATEKALYFFAYTFLKNKYQLAKDLFSSNSTQEIGAFPNLILGCLAEWAHLPVTLPIDCLTTTIQTQGSSGSSNKSAFALMSALLAEKGLSGMYKGIQAYTILCLKPAIQYTIYEQLKQILLMGRRAKQQQKNNKKHLQLSALEAFFLGMIARTISTICVFPFLRAKVMLQSEKSSSSPDGDESTVDKKSANPSIPKMLIKMYTEDGGIKTLYKGLGPELTRGVLSSALMLMVKEKISGIVYALLHS